MIRRVWLSALIFVVFAVPAGADDDPGAKLQQLRERMGSLQKELERDADRRDKEAVRLREAEQEAAAAAAELRRTRIAIADHRRRLDALGEDKRNSESRLESGRVDLAVQVRAAYLGGRQERLRMLLNQQDPALLGRMLVYYRYLSEFRAEQIEAVVAELSRLVAVERALVDATRELEELENQRRRKAAKVEQARETRAAALVRLDARIEDNAQAVARLQSEEQTLLRLIEELQRALEDLPGAQREPFAKQRGKLTWPVKGSLLHDFGQPRAGGSLRWNGVMVSAERGAEVRAVYHGRVAYADWLPGMGLLLVIEHGDDYLSLYGHNDVLFKQIGDWVQPGEVIAAAGDSGGRSRAALYFEIRQGKRPQDPHRWIGARLSAR
ncbi:MAG: peptidoglycan DD-metalloendopeptidase family protein [Gammaproteobacteria bacterium]